MSSQPLDTGWDFGPVLDLIDSDTYVASSSSSPASQPSVPAHSRKQIKESASVQSLHLGSFAKVFEQLGIFIDEALPPISPIELESGAHPNPDYALHISSARVDNAEALQSDVSKPTRSSQEYDFPVTYFPAGLTKKQRQKARKKAEKECSSNSSTEKEPFQRESGLQKVKTLAETTVPKVSASFMEAEEKHARAQSRSNVGAKLRAATPVQMVSPTKNSKRPASPAARKEQAAIARPAKAPINKAQPALSKSLNALAQPVTPAQTKQSLPTHRRVEAAGPLPATAKSDHAFKAPHVAVSTPTPVQHTSALMLPQMGGYFTPQASAPAVHNHGLVPRTVQPVMVQRSHHAVVTPQPVSLPVTPSGASRSITVRPKTDRHYHFFQQLLNSFPQDMPWLVAPMQLCNEKASTEGIHIFVDASNILIGLKDIIRRNRYPHYELSFDSLALLMERRRPIAKRIYAGSHREANQLAHVTKLTEMSQAVGYENIVKEQVFIQREDSERRKFFKEVERVGWYKATQRRSVNGSGSDSETGPAAQPTIPYAPKWVEQGVDEIIHLKMCQSIIDTEVPSTMVLATGDGAEAEHSDGFLAHVERALKKGWKIELVSWRQQTSGGYKNKKFRTKWGDQFKIIELDDYLESLIETP